MAILILKYMVYSYIYKYISVIFITFRRDNPLNFFLTVLVKSTVSLLYMTFEKKLCPTLN